MVAKAQNAAAEMVRARAAVKHGCDVAGGATTKRAAFSFRAARAMTARAVGESDTPSVLAVVLDCNPLEWATRTDEDLPALLEQFLIFANAFWMLSSANRLLVIGAHPAAARQLWPETPERAAEPAPPHRLRHALARGVDELLALDATSPPTDGRPLLAPALSLATLRIQRARREQPLLQPRVLVLHASADEPSEHLRLVDLAFANQKLEVRAGSARDPLMDGLPRPTPRLESLTPPPSRPDPLRLGPSASPPPFSRPAAALPPQRRAAPARRCTSHGRARSLPHRGCAPGPVHAQVRRLPTPRTPPGPYSSPRTPVTPGDCSHGASHGGIPA
eukprot:scaffold15478_cov117-Isochrysis_galbana.AAC.4